MQHTVLTTGYHLLCRADAARGISAMPPADYAERFEAFVLHEVLHRPSCYLVITPQSCYLITTPSCCM